jgi:hypothetical protein
MKKKLLCLLMLMPVLLGLAACQNSTSDNSTAVNSTEAVTETQTETEAPTEKETLLSRDRMTYTGDITYDTLARYPDKNIDKPVKFDGKVIQMIGAVDSNYTAIRMAVDDDYNHVLLVVYANDVIDGKLLENDKITIYGGYVGQYSYTSTLNKPITIPQVQAVMIDLHDNN